MSVIIFAPAQTGLALQPREVATMINAFNRPLLAHTEDELRQCIESTNRDGDGVEGFWFIGHSGPAGIVVNDVRLSPAVIGQYLSTAGVQWSYFSSCESASFIEDVQSIYPHDAYAYITEIFDYPAWRNAALIAANYKNGGDIHQAVRQAAPPRSTPLRFFPSERAFGGRVSMREERIDDRLAVQMQDLTKAIYALQNEIALSEQRTKMEIALLTKRVEQIERNGDTTRPLFNEWQTNRIVGVLVVIAALLAYALYLMASGG